MLRECMKEMFNKEMISFWAKTLVMALLVLYTVCIIKLDSVKACMELEGTIFVAFYAIMVIFASMARGLLNEMDWS